uniref:Uncharacterized protein n=1 Tax=Mizugakiibacter sediminis TaxID=1475481 RepID=A0A0S6YVV6_9GAMM
MIAQQPARGGQRRQRGAGVDGVRAAGMAVGVQRHDPLAVAGLDGGEVGARIEAEAAVGLQEFESVVHGAASTVSDSHCMLYVKHHVPILRKRSQNWKRLG